MTRWLSSLGDPPASYPLVHHPPGLNSPLCVCCGTQTDDRLTQRSVVRGLGALWLLLLLGPVAWLVLLAWSWSSSEDRTLAAVLPYCRSCYAVLVARRRRMRVAVAVGLMTGVAAIWESSQGQPWGALAIAAAAVGACASGLIEWWRLRWYRVATSLDVSGRWVTLAGVHPRLSAALDASNSSSWSRP